MLRKCQLAPNEAVPQDRCPHPREWCDCKCHPDNRDLDDERPTGRIERAPVELSPDPPPAPATPRPMIPTTRPPDPQIMLPPRVANRDVRVGREKCPRDGCDREIAKSGPGRASHFRWHDKQAEVGPVKTAEQIVAENHRAVCPHGDETCPCPDGDPCHYVSSDGPRGPVRAMRCPRTDLVDCDVCAAPASSARTTTGGGMPGQTITVGPVTQTAEPLLHVEANGKIPDPTDPLGQIRALLAERIGELDAERARLQAALDALDG